MLVLTRKVGESIVINENITIRILSITGSRVRMGFEAPDEVGILRGELVLEIADDSSREEGSTIHE